MNPIVETLERELLTPFREFAEQLSATYPNVQARVYSHEMGSLTEYQGHGIFIDCLLTDAPGNLPDNVALCVDLAHLNSSLIISADVYWGHPSGRVEAEFSFDPVEVSDKVLSELYADLPRLYEALTEEVRRGKPSNWDEGHA
jgi:hypothetical protein